MSHVDPHYARSEDYRRQLEEIQASGVCPFCPESFHWHPNPIIRELGGWRITKIREAYPNAALHLIIIADRHVEEIDELSPTDWTALGQLLNWVVDKYHVEGGGLAFRFGPMRLTGSTVQHLHAHLIVPEVDESTGRAKVVNFPIG